jgi:glycosyltransferase involved in cell wall biosynthesis
MWSVNLKVDLFTYLMVNSPLVSVIIPTYNREQLVSYAIQSILNQTYGDWELLVVDDGSTDQTEEVIRLFKDPRISYYQQKNLGPAAARNYGLRVARGELIAFLDSDDLFATDKLERQVAWMNNHPEISLGFTGYQEIDGEGNPTGYVATCQQGNITLIDLLKGWSFSFSTVMVRKACVEGIGLLDESFRSGEEWEWMLRMSLNGELLAGLPEPLTLGRVHSGNMVRSPQIVGDQGLRILDIVFSQPNFPAELKNFRPVARAYQWAILSALGVVDKNIQLSIEFALRAAQELKGANRKDIHDIALRVIHVARGLSQRDTKDTFQEMESLLFRKGKEGRKFARLLQSVRYEVEAAEHFQSNDRLSVIRYGTQSLYHSFPRIENKGILMMMARSILGINNNRKLEE